MLITPIKQIILLDNFNFDKKKLSVSRNLTKKIKLYQILKNWNKSGTKKNLKSNLTFLGKNMNKKPKK